MATTKSTTKQETVLTDDEKAAMKELARERRAARSGKFDGLADVLAKIAEMPEADRELAQRVHEIVLETAPGLTPKTWYGMPAYARDGKIVCFFQAASKFKARYATLGFDESANLDDGSMWPVSYAITALTPANEARIAELVKQAVG
jgi:uncharacterized protein YdhG (YjbR/CyaY superfamily)